MSERQVLSPSVSMSIDTPLLPPSCAQFCQVLIPKFSTPAVRSPAASTRAGTVDAAPTARRSNEYRDSSGRVCAFGLSAPRTSGDTMD